MAKSKRDFLKEMKMPEAKKEDELDLGLEIDVEPGEEMDSGAAEAKSLADFSDDELRAELEARGFKVDQSDIEAMPDESMEDEELELA